MEQLALQRNRFVKTLRRLRALGTTHPFIPERVSALQAWTTTDTYAALWKRGRPQDGRWLVIERVAIKHLPDNDRLALREKQPYGTGAASDPIVELKMGNQTFSSGPVQDENNPLFDLRDEKWRVPYTPNLQAILEVFDDDALSRERLGAATVSFPDGKSTITREVSAALIDPENPDGDTAARSRARINFRIE